MKDGVFFFRLLPIFGVGHQKTVEMRLPQLKIVFLNGSNIYTFHVSRQHGDAQSKEAMDFLQK